MTKKFIIVRCLECREIKVTKGVKMFTCHKCGKINKISDENVIRYASSGEEARKIVSELKAHKLNR